MLTTPLAFLPSWAWRVLGYGLLAIALFGFGYLKGDEHGTGKLTEYVGKQATESAKIVTRQVEIGRQVVTQYVQTTKVIHDQVQTTQDAITKNVPRGVVLSFTWRLLHDAAVTGTVPDAAGRTDGSGVDAQDALSTVAENYGIARLNAEQLTELQIWVCREWKSTHPGEAPQFDCPGG